jgi:cytochrome c553
MRPLPDPQASRLPRRRPSSRIGAIAVGCVLAGMAATPLSSTAAPAFQASASSPAAAASASSPRPPSLPDTLEQRLLACTGCHGEQGRATPDGYSPRIAGKPAGYLYNQLAHFRDGRRGAPSMTWMVARLPDAYLHEIAAHFAGLHPPYPLPPAPNVPAAVLEHGRRLALEGDSARDLPACASCHGDAMLGVEPAIPGLLGLPRDYLNAQLGAWRTGTRRAHAPDCMATIARRLAADDVWAVSAWLAAQPVPTPAQAVPATARPLPLECGGLAR